MTKQEFKTKMYKASPYICFGVGVAGFVGSLVTAIKATRKLSYIIDEHNMAVQEAGETFIEEVEGLEETSEEYTAIEKNHKLVVRKQNFTTIGRICRLYAPTAVLSVTAISGFTAAFGMMRGRYTASSAALACVTKTFDDYRARVVDKYGEMEDKALYYGMEREKITVEETDPETGKTKKTKKEMLVGTPKAPFTYLWEGIRQDGSGIGFSQWHSAGAIYDAPYIKGIIAQYQLRLDTYKEDVPFYKLIEELGWEKKLTSAEVLAGWKPGDRILCGIEDGDNMTAEAYDYMVGKRNTIHLTFNPRPDIFGAYKIESDAVVEENSVEEAYETVAIEEKEVKGDD